MDKTLRILVIEDCQADFLLLEHHLKQHGLAADCVCTASMEELHCALDKGGWDIVLADYNVPGLNFLDCLNSIHARELDLPVILVSGTVGEEKAVDLLKQGVSDFVLKSNLTRLIPAIERSLREAAGRRARRDAEEALLNAEARYRTLFNESPNGILLIDPETGNTIDANETAHMQLGYTREEFIALRISDYEAIETPEEITSHIQKIIHDGADNFETLHRTKSGEIRNVYVRVKSLQLSDRSLLYAIFHDITERKQVLRALSESEKSAKAQAKENESMAAIGRIISSTLNIDEVYERFAGEVQKLIPIDRLTINIINWKDNTATTAYISGTEFPHRKKGNVYPVALTMTDEVGRTRRSILINEENYRDYIDRFPGFALSLQDGLRSVIVVPLISKDEVIGALQFRSTYPSAYSEKDLQLAERVGNQIAGAIANAKLFQEWNQVEEQLRQTLDSLRKAVNTTIQVLVTAVETRDPYTAGHQVRAANLARAIATEMELPQEKIEGIRMVGTIHDIGKLSIPAEILSKPTKLSEVEFAFIKEHAQRGFEMLKDVESAWPLAEIVFQHHERMDGSGYPRNLKGEEILMEARILTVADVVEAMASHRPYRPGLGIEAALAEIEKNSGIFYDNAVADACLTLFQKKGFQLESA